MRLFSFIFVLSIFTTVCYGEDITPPVTEMCKIEELKTFEKFDSPESVGPQGKAGAHGFKSLIGIWKVENGAVSATAALPGDPKWPNGHEAVNEFATDLGDMVLSGDFKLGASPRIAFVCRDTQKPNNHLCRVVATPKSIWIQKMSGISKTTKAEVLVKLDVEIDPESWHHLTMEICGDKIIAKIDGHVLKAQHERFKDHKGLVGMNAFKEGSQFKNVAIWSATPNK